MQIILSVTETLHVNSKKKSKIECSMFKRCIILQVYSNYTFLNLIHGGKEENTTLTNQTKTTQYTKRNIMTIYTRKCILA